MLSYFYMHFLYSSKVIMFSQTPLPLEHFPCDLYMGQFGQFGLNGFKQGQTHFSQLHISLDPDELESCSFVCSLITVIHGFAKVMGCDG